MLQNSIIRFSARKRPFGPSTNRPDAYQRVKDYTATKFTKRPRRIGETPRRARGAASHACFQCVGVEAAPVEKEETVPPGSKSDEKELRTFNQ
eukprot:2503727-Pleurochrysis_carterae.AAC.1